MTVPGQPQVPTIDVLTAAAAADGTPPDRHSWLTSASATSSSAFRAPGAVLYPTSSFLLRFEELPREDVPLHVVCNSGSRSTAVTAWLPATAGPTSTT